MKTKTQLKNTSKTRSLAMKKSWAERRNSPGRKLARERTVIPTMPKRKPLPDLPPGVTIPVPGARGSFRTVVVGSAEHLEHIGHTLNEIRSMVAHPPKSPQPVGVRRMIATNMLQGMLASRPYHSQYATPSDMKLLAEQAYGFADALIAAEGQ